MVTRFWSKIRPKMGTGSAGFGQGNDFENLNKVVRQGLGFEQRPEDTREKPLWEMRFPGRGRASAQSQRQENAGMSEQQPGGWCSMRGSTSVAKAGPPQFGTHRFSPCLYYLLECLWASQLISQKCAYIGVRKKSLVQLCSYVVCVCQRKCM